MDLDTLLAASAPPVAARTPHLEDQLAALVAASESRHGRRRRSVRLALVGGATAGLFGLGAVAAAAGVLPSWTVVTASGHSCQVEVGAIAIRSGDVVEPGTPTFGADEERRTLAAAKAFLAGFDDDAIDHQQAIRDWQRTHGPADEQVAAPTGDDLEVLAVSRAVIAQLRDALAAEHLDIRAIGVTVSSEGCTP